jgi:phage terminase large subunit
VGLHENEWYVDEVLYETGLDSEMLHKRMEERMGEARGAVNYCDSSRPEMIEYLRKRGWNVKPCSKGRNSVMDGITFVKSKRLNITRRSTNILREQSGYRWVLDRSGKIQDAPIDYDDHAMDAIRYACVDGYAHRGGPTKYETVEKRSMTNKGAW